MENKTCRLQYPELTRIEIAAKSIQTAAEAHRSHPNVSRSHEDWMWYNLASALDDIAKGLRRINEKLEKQKCLGDKTNENHCGKATKRGLQK